MASASAFLLIVIYIIGICRLLGAAAMTALTGTAKGLWQQSVRQRPNQSFIFVPADRAWDPYVFR